MGGKRTPNVGLEIRNPTYPTDFIKRSHVPKDSARRIIQALMNANIINELRPGGGRRATIYVFQKLIDITDRRS